MDSIEPILTSFKNIPTEAELSYFFFCSVFGLLTSLFIFWKFTRICITLIALFLFPRLFKPSGRMPWIDYTQESTDWDLLPAWLHNLQQRPMAFRWKLFHKYSTMKYVDVVESYLAASGETDILTLGAGSGSLYPYMLDLMKDHGWRNVTVMLSDIHPDPEAYAKISAQYEQITYEAKSVDAFKLESDKRLRMVSATFHHFPPKFASQLFQSAVEDEAPIFIMDGGSSRFFTVFLPMFHTFLYPASYLYWLGDPIRLITPPLAIPLHMYDGFGSGLRFYDCEDISNLLKGIPNVEKFQWYTFCGTLNTIVLGHPNHIPRLDLTHIGKPFINPLSSAQNANPGKQEL